mmetsp:Transcript_73794/g.123281  ORF Transcript_73794/g.123281 Transcript_73794/m.123281 type:complete len:308 (-) Transcript_73794:121-1044(-)
MAHTLLPSSSHRCACTTSWRTRRPRHRKLPCKISYGGESFFLAPRISLILEAFRPRVCRSVISLPSQNDDWSCGYRNVGSLLRSILGMTVKQVKPLSLQQLLEQAWRLGFDPYSAEEFSHKLAGKEGKAAHIGAAEMLVLLWYHQLDANLIEVHDTKGAGEAVFEVARTLLELWQANKSSGTCWPIVLQHDGHSRTIVGVTTAPRCDPECCVLVRDPRDKPGEIQCIPYKKLDGRQYQIVFVQGDGSQLLTEEELERKKGDLPIAAKFQDGQWTGIRRSWNFTMMTRKFERALVSDLQHQVNSPNDF